MGFAGRLADMRPRVRMRILLGSPESKCAWEAWLTSSFKLWDASSKEGCVESWICICPRCDRDKSGVCEANAGEVSYGVELLDEGLNLWGIDFPEPSESEMAVGGVLLECVRCHSQELAYLDEFEVEVLETNQSLSRPCRRCTDTSVWKKSMPREGAELPPPPPPRMDRARRTKNDRKHVRLDLKVDVCVRHPQLGQEVVTTVNVSRGGFRFRSTKGYGEGWVIEAALPYSKTGANIFTHARIVYVGEPPGEKAYVYGVTYLPKMQAEITV